MRVYVITSQVPSNIKRLISIKESDYIIAVDGAFDELIKQKVKIDLVIGDMDSVKNLRQLRKYEQIKLPRVKDETDSHAALNHAYSLTNNVIMIGGIQGARIEHFIANMLLLDKFPNLLIMDNNSKVYLLKEGSHVVTKSEYVSFFAKEDSIISLHGFKYELENYKLNRFNPLAISNEILASYGEVDVKKGEVYIIKTKEKR